MGNDGSKSRGAGGSGGGPNRPPSSGVAVKNPFKSGPSSSVVTQHLENAKKSRVLQLKGTGLKELPERLSEVGPMLRNLDVSGNRLKELPISIGAFIELKQLHLEGNLLEFLPDEIGCLRKLEVLNVAQNKLRSLPNSLVGCSSLRIVNVSQNQLTTLPVVLCHLRDLDIVNVSQNRITELPDEISHLMASELIANQNQITTLNSSNLVKCARLKILRVEENCLPREQFDTAILQDSQIALIAYTGNLFAAKDFQGLPGYEEYQHRYTATQRKM